METFIQLFHAIYDDIGSYEEDLSAFIGELEGYKDHFDREKTVVKDWYKDAIVYSMYVNYFNDDMSGLIDKLDELKELGVNCLWLLPILESPMKDAGFDISDYTKVREELLGSTTFEQVIEEAHARGIRIIFDIAMNHCSMEHKWFNEARHDENSPYRDYFIWADDDKGYPDARIIFKGMCTNNWEYDEIAKKYYYHRFFEIQPDLNYRNPKVLFEMTITLIDWKLKGVDGFRADAVPYMWKEEGTICENLPKTHMIVKFMRAVLDYLQEGSLFLAEACQPPDEVVAYFGDGDECQAAYHFPVMPRVYKALASGDKTPIVQTLNESVTPRIPDGCQWFMFLRCHDELTLEMVSPEERQYIYGQYAKKPLWDFRQGEGISARIADLFDFNPDRIELAYSVMFTLLGTPILYYGDEYAKGNDEAYYEAFSKMTGYEDSRYLVRGPIDWEWVDRNMEDNSSLTYQIFNRIKAMITARKEHKAFSRGSLDFIDVKAKMDGTVCDSILSYIRSYEDDCVLVLQNLSGEQVVVDRGQMVKDLEDMNISLEGSNQLYGLCYRVDDTLELPPYGVVWCQVTN